MPAPAASRGLTVADAMGVWDSSIRTDTTVDEALTVFAAVPAASYLLVLDQSGRCEGVVTRASLAAFLARSWYSARTPVRDTHHQRGPFAWPTMPLALAAESMRVKRQDVWPVTDDDGRLLGVLTPRAARDALQDAT